MVSVVTWLKISEGARKGQRGNNTKYGVGETAVRKNKARRRCPREAAAEGMEVTGRTV